MGYEKVSEGVSTPVIANCPYREKTNMLKKGVVDTGLYVHVRHVSALYTLPYSVHSRTARLTALFIKICLVERYVLQKTNHLNNPRRVSSEP